MSPGVGVEGGDADQAVYPAFRFQEAVCEGPVELEGGAFYSGAFPVLKVEFRNGPALFFAVHPVHAQEHFGPVLAFCAAGAGVDLHDAGKFVLGLVECALELHLFYLAEGFVIRFAGLLFGGLAGFPEIEQDGKVFNRGIDGVVEFDPVFVEFDVLENFGGALVVVPETRA
jgi:hypothetical protein